ncbi:MAG: glycosyltransferase family 2 protein [Candidatus Binatia bacterium]
MRISIIVPVYNDPLNLVEALSAIRAFAHPDVETIVVDDGSTDDIASAVDQTGVRLLTLSRNSGPAAARNYGARHAQGDVLFFVDADVVLAPDALKHVEEAFQEQSDLAAVFGSYDAEPRAPGLISQYRNLLHHFVHQNGHSEASTFWAGCGAIRRPVFEAIGGFDEKRFPLPSIEDIELGYRLRRAGYRILLHKSLQGKHLKRWNFLSVIKTDISRRAVPWTRLILETGNVPADLNLKWAQRASFVLTALACAFLALSTIRPGFLAPAGIAILGVFLLNRKLYAFLLRRKGILFAAACVPLHLLYFLYSGVSYLYVWIDFRLRRTISARGLSRPEVHRDRNTKA